MKIKIVRCSNQEYWYNKAVGQVIECDRIELGWAIIKQHVIESIDGSDSEGDGRVNNSDYIITQGVWISVKDDLPVIDRIVPIKLKRSNITDVLMGYRNNEDLWVCMNSVHNNQDQIIEWYPLSE